MTSPITRYIYQKSMYNSKSYQNTQSTTSQTQQDRFNELNNLITPATNAIIFTVSIFIIIHGIEKFIKSIKKGGAKHGRTR